MIAPEKLLIEHRNGFRWRTMKGEVFRLDQMETSHIFNSMKMIFNHIAFHYGADPIWFQHQYSDYHQRAVRNPKKLAWNVALFVFEIEKRGDLPEKYREPYKQIIDQILNMKKLKQDLDSLPEAEEQRRAMHPVVKAFLGPSMGEIIRSQLDGTVENGLDLDQDEYEGEDDDGYF